GDDLIIERRHEHGRHQEEEENKPAPQKGSWSGFRSSQDHNRTDSKIEYADVINVPLTTICC
ncbi:hypothetical protein ACC745_38230, partial [Rhizobium ruizarguesonis]